MKLLRIIPVCLLALSHVLHAQPSQALPEDSAGAGPDIRAGVVRVQKPNIIPYVKVEYRLSLAHVTQVNVEVPVNNGIPGYTEIDRVPVYDSMRFPQSLSRVFPQKKTLLSRYFTDNMSYMYSSAAPRTDTLFVGMWIDKSGKIRFVQADTSNTKMPVDLAGELVSLSNSLRNTEWGKGGGYATKKKFLRPSEYFSESYYCEMFIIVSSAPLTDEQRNTGVHYAPFDFPLNSPPADQVHADSMLRNRRE
jgi:hypothetical protein